LPYDRKLTRHYIVSKQPPLINSLWLGYSILNGRHLGKREGAISTQTRRRFRFCGSNLIRRDPQGGFKEPSQEAPKISIRQVFFEEPPACHSRLKKLQSDQGKGEGLYPLGEENRNPSSQHLSPKNGSRLKRNLGGESVKGESR